MQAIAAPYIFDVAPQFAPKAVSSWAELIREGNREPRGRRMTKLLQHIEEMRVRLSEIASDEQALVQALGDALDRLDQQLLRDVRSIATEHELRREEILGELQGLAGGIGMFRAPLPAPPAPEELPNYRRANGFQQRIVAPGDWRQATSNIEDDVDFHANGQVNGRAPSH
jgi:hypothetical protein